MRAAILFSLALAIGVSVSAGPIIIGPIPVSGSGTYAVGFPGIRVFAASFSGSNGTDFFSVQDFYGPFLGSSTGSGSGGTARIDGMFFDNFTFSLGDGGGFITGFDNQNNPVITASLISYINITSTRCSGPPGSLIQDCDYGVAITSTDPNPLVPEPAAWSLMAFGLAGLGMAQRRESKKSTQ